MNIRAVIFDIYGTLLEVGPPPPDADTRWQSLFRDMLHIEPRFSRLDFFVATSKVVARRHELSRARGIHWPEVHWPSVVTEIVPELSQLSCRDQSEFLVRQIQTGHTTRLTSETVAALRWIKERQLLSGIASNAQAYTLDELEEALAPHGLGLNLFEPELCFWSFEHGFSKPDPHVFQILNSRLEARAIHSPEILMVGDRLDNDIKPARDHGWKTWHLGRAADGDWAGLHEMLQEPPADNSP